jgi:glycosyltransferase involved in cell wall biosynthesis
MKVQSPLDRVSVGFESLQEVVDTNDLVSVVITLFNYDKYIIESLQSVFDQTYNPIEIIVVDDKSTDCSVATATEWMKQNFGRFQGCKLILHPHNRGLSLARNSGIARARGEYVFVLDADNMIYPRAIERLRKSVIIAGSEAAYSQLEFFGEAKGIGTADVFRRDYFKFRNYIDAMALFKRSALLAVGGYTNIDGGWEDFELWCKFLDANFDAVFVPEILSRYRLHGDSMTRTETSNRFNDVLVQLTIRHPWLSLEI